MQKEEAVKLLSNLYIEIFHGDILFNDQSLWKYVLLVSDMFLDTIFSPDDPDQFDKVWNQMLGRSIVLSSSIIRHIIQRYDYRRISDSVKICPGDIDSVDITSRINFLLQTIERLLPLLQHLRLIDIYGHVCEESSPLVCLYNMVINCTQLLLLTLSTMKEHSLSFPDELFNRILSLIEICDDLLCSSLLFDIASVLCKGANPENHEGLEYASWGLVSASHFQYNDDSLEFYVTRIPHSFIAAMVDFTNIYSLSCNQSISQYDSLLDLVNTATDRSFDCIDFLVFRQKLLSHWGVMKGSGPKLYENLLNVVRRLNSKTENSFEVQSYKTTLTIDFNPKRIVFYYELLLQMAVTSFALAEPMVISSTSSPYQDLQNYLYLFGAIISFFNDGQIYKEVKYRKITFHVCTRILKLCHEKLERCIHWRLKQLVQPETGRRSSALSDPLALSHLGSFLDVMKASCVCKIDSMVSEFRLYVRENQLRSIEKRGVKYGLRKIEELSIQSCQLGDRIQHTCLTYSLHASSLELVMIPIRGSAIETVSKRVRKRAKRKRDFFDEGVTHDSSSSSISSSPSHSNSTESDLVHDTIIFQDDGSVPGSTSDDSFAVIGRWGRDETEDGNELLVLNYS